MPHLALLERLNSCWEGPRLRMWTHRFQSKKTRCEMFPPLPKCDFQPYYRSFKNLGGWKRCQLGLAGSAFDHLQFPKDTWDYVISPLTSDTRKKRKHPIILCHEMSHHSTAKKLSSNIIRHPTFHKAPSQYHRWYLQNIPRTNIKHPSRLVSHSIPLKVSFRAPQVPTARVQWKTERPPVVGWQDGPWVVGQQL